MGIKASIVGGSGYAGGELIRLLWGHPGVEIQQVTSRTYAKRFVRMVHPNLRGFTSLKFCEVGDLKPCDVLFLCMPHGKASGQIDHFAGVAERITDLSADFRLRDAEAYGRW